MISVIIPVYNNEKYIARCLDSVLAQTYSEWEAVVVNDGSTDNSGTIIRSYAEKDARIRYFEQKNQGVSAARNLGIDQSHGEYILFLDGDDWLDENVLEKLFSVIMADDLDCVSYMFRHVYEDGTPVKEDGADDDMYYRLDFPRQAARFFDTAARHVFYTSQQHLFRKSIIAENSIRFAPGIRCGEDVLFAHMYSVFIRRGVILAFHGYNYYHHAESCISINSEPWSNVVEQNMKCCDFMAQYIKKTGKTIAGYELANRCWEFLLHFSGIEKKYPDKAAGEQVMRSSCVRQVVFPYILHYGPWRRKVMLCVFMLSRKLFCKLVKI